MSLLKTDSSITIKTAAAQAEIAFHGAHIYSWKVAGQEQLFLSSASSISGPAAIRGGIPICFPVFGPPPPREPYSSLKQHGFARNTIWSFDGVEQGNEWIEARFRLSSNNPEVQKVFKPAFECVYKVKICERSLLTSLEGLSFADKVAGGAVGTEERSAVDFLAGEVDRVYTNVPAEINVDLGHGKRISIKTSGLPDLTVWNPHEAKEQRHGRHGERGVEAVRMHRAWPNDVCFARAKGVLDRLPRAHRSSLRIPSLCFTKLYLVEIRIGLA
ncbi:hypothetical protein PCASD_16600 [Puccinia coronata f. sp. avenae]|uniref:Glucose-6-phosphate 1-epimerase n=1 Tax=Puccinia coronata f. sp. avenae TaxID=200324 RepID=A0A2N5TWP5_9BASI|nr:hypothetical protein PCASD_16600 [Puccinia coronata f. sp. avenae]